MMNDVTMNETFDIEHESNTNEEIIIQLINDLSLIKVDNVVLNYIEEEAIVSVLKDNNVKFIKNDNIYECSISYLMLFKKTFSIQITNSFILFRGDMGNVLLRLDNGEIYKNSSELLDNVLNSLIENYKLMPTPAKQGSPEVIQQDLIEPNQGVLLEEEFLTMDYEIKKNYYKSLHKIQEQISEQKKTKKTLIIYVESEDSVPTIENIFEIKYDAIKYYEIFNKPNYDILLVTSINFMNYINDLALNECNLLIVTKTGRVSSLDKGFNQRLLSKINNPLSTIKNIYVLIIYSKIKLFQEHDNVNIKKYMDENILLVDKNYKFVLNTEIFINEEIINDLKIFYNNVFDWNISGKGKSKTIHIKFKNFLTILFKQIFNLCKFYYYKLQFEFNNNYKDYTIQIADDINLKKLYIAIKMNLDQFSHNINQNEFILKFLSKNDNSNYVIFKKCKITLQISDITFKTKNLIDTQKINNNVNKILRNIIAKNFDFEYNYVDDI
jgi:hypothetical protein